MGRGTSRVAAATTRTATATTTATAATTTATEATTTTTTATVTTTETLTASRKQKTFQQICIEKLSCESMPYPQYIATQLLLKIYLGYVGPVDTALTSSQTLHDQKVQLAEEVVELALQYHYTSWETFYQAIRAQLGKALTLADHKSLEHHAGLGQFATFHQLADAVLDRLNKDSSRETCLTWLSENGYKDRYVKLFEEIGSVTQFGFLDMEKKTMGEVRKHPLYMFLDTLYQYVISRKLETDKQSQLVATVDTFFGDAGGKFHSKCEWILKTMIHMLSLKSEPSTSLKWWKNQVHTFIENGMQENAKIERELSSFAQSASRVVFGVMNLFQAPQSEESLFTVLETLKRQIESFNVDEPTSSSTAAAVPSPS